MKDSVAGAHGDITRAASSLLPALPPQARIEAATAALILALPRLEDSIIPDPSRAPLSSATSRSSSPARPPWSPPAAYALLGIGIFTSRAYVILGGHALDLPPGPCRPEFYLARIPGRVTSAPDDRALHDAARLLERSLTSARQALGDEERWSPLPRLHLHGPPRCPHQCSLPSLRMRPQQGVVRCVTPGCRDSDSLPRPEARLYPRRAPAAASAASPGGWAWHLIWRDGTEGVLPGLPSSQRKKEEAAA